MINRIHKVDCVEGMRMLDAKSIDLTVTSPPYDDLRNYNGYSFDFESVAKELYRVTKDGGVVVWVVGDKTEKGSETGTSFRQALYFKEVGFNLHDTMIYAKRGGLRPNPKIPRFSPCFEYMFVLSKGKPKSFCDVHKREECKTAGVKVHAKQRQVDGSMKKLTAFGDVKKSDRRADNIWFYNIGFNSSTKDKVAFEHPAIFPEKLAEDHILSWSSEGDIVLDPFMGSGTTAKMAHINDRKYIGFEISEEYINIANKRLEESA